MKIRVIIILSILSLLSGCKFYDHTNPLDPDYKGEMPIIKNIKEVYSFKFQSWPLETPTCLDIRTEDEIYFGTNSGRVYKYTASSSSLIKIQAPNGAVEITDIKVFDENYFFITASKEADSSFVFMYKDSKWTTICSVYKNSSLSGVYNEFITFSFINSQEFFLVYQTTYGDVSPNDNKHEILYYKNGILTEYDLPEEIYDIKAFDSKNVYALGKSQLWSYDGIGWSSIQDISNYSFKKFQYIDNTSALLLGSSLYEYKNGLMKSLNISNPKDIHFLDINFGAIVVDNGDFTVYENGITKNYAISECGLMKVKMFNKNIGYSVGLGYQQQKCVIVKYGDFPLER
ncbi:MAG: hypothetical protein CO137_01265 [Candidatus Magasanikbacteria bacterium CG_4_9_14_3_um_filter_32_9]|uniref:Uncharacterized protein n=1 Tax=Candidatus Magasanikbacteria bacterium CG_4_9_14_3_um_filter_32_9 TaxID=1974644 RepID=A0A2M7Z788_9BACT|nr:MAG: hypothetical protein CO137_01265 [Candidatus Magasanikbacteria bacterium CG_4_9_14_3_um_filter_32_9]